jgi:hypothetical protein
MVKALAHQLEKILDREGIKIKVDACNIEKDPFVIL